MKTEEKSRFDRNIQLIEEFRRGNREAGEQLAELNKPLVLSIANRFIGRGAEQEELCEAGYIGLVKAINSFDFEKGCAFSTYAVPLIFGEIRRFLRDDGIIKVSREQKKLSAILARERERRLNSGEECSIRAIAAAVGVSVQDASAAIFAASSVRSIEENVYEDDGDITIRDVLFDEFEEEKKFESLALKLAIEKLDEPSRKLILLRYYRDYSQVETAKILGLSQVKVSREEKRILSLLRSYLS